MKLTAELAILIIDDSEEVFNVYKSILTKKGLRNLFFAKSAEEAMSILDSQQKNNKPIGLIFCDWQMPGQSGIELLLTIKSSEETKKIPFIMATANNDFAHVTEAVQAGVNDYIVKPIIAEVLLQKIAKAFKK